MSGTIAAGLVHSPGIQATDSPTGSPPWQHGQNNDADPRGLEFTEPDADNLADFHGNPNHPALSLYVGGDYYFAMAPLVAAFEAKYPQYKGRLYWETISPSLLTLQMRRGGTITVGNMTWSVKPDVYLAGLSCVRKQVDAGLLQGPVIPYVTDKLTIMVAVGNPMHITDLSALSAPSLKVAMPNPEFEGMAKQIKTSLNKAGGQVLETQVYENKVDLGSTQLTSIHHRQIPLWIIQGRADAGVTWTSEAIFQQQIGNPISRVDIPPKDNTTAIYAGAIVKGTAHAQAAQRWLDFIRCPKGISIFERYGFKPYYSDAASVNSSTIVD